MYRQMGMKCHHLPLQHIHQYDIHTSVSVCFYLYHQMYYHYVLVWEANRHTDFLQNHMNASQTNPIPFQAHA